MEKDFPIDIVQWLMSYGLSNSIASLLSATVMLFVSVILVWLLYLVAKRVIVRFLHIFIKHTKAKWDDVFVEYQVFDKLIIILPVLVLSESMPYVLSSHSFAAAVAQRGLSLVVVVLVIRAIFSALDASNVIAESSQLTKRLPIKSFVQLIKLFLFFIGVILATAAITQQSPFFFLSGLGVATGLIMLVFKDTILGFVAGIQLATNRMVTVGDWIQMDKYGADGNVSEVTLTTVKVKNFDNTLTMIPAYALVSDSFKNWQSMSESGGRRIKRAVNIDLDTVRFLDEQDKAELAKVNLLKHYLPEMETKIITENQRIDDIDNPVNGRRLTNIGTFRAYLKEFVSQHDKIHKGMTVLVRQLAPTQTGVPIELYIFTNDTNWNHYEDIQADIFDHIFAILPQFGLKVYQAPSGNDVRQVGKTT